MPEVIVISLNEVLIDGQQVGGVVDAVMNYKLLKETQAAIETWATKVQADADDAVNIIQADADARVSALNIAVATLTKERDALGTTEQAQAIIIEQKKLQLQETIDAATAELKALSDVEVVTIRK